MAEKEFFDRKNELKLLQDKYNGLSPSEMVVLYGRRRVGKTELVKQFLKNIKNHFYFYVEVTQKSEILNYLSKSVKEQLGEKLVFKDFYEFLSYIGDKSEKEPFVLVIDEFQRFLDIAPEYISSLQNAWDSKLKNKNIFILLLGSSIGMIQKIMNSKAGALYGRAQKIKISPFKYSDFRLMFKELSEEEKVIVYSVFGGTPDYLNKFKKSKGDIHERIFDLVLKKGAVLFEEPKNLLEYENVRIHAKYNAILGATSSGKETMKEIQDITHIPSQTMPAYLSRLDELLDLVRRNNPVLGKERLGRELLVLYNTKEIKGLKLNFENIGSWWDRNNNEIDVLAYNLKEKNFLLGEVKWTNKQLDTDVIVELERKSKYLNHSGTYKFLFVSKNGFTEKALKKMQEIGAIHLDLKEMEELFSKAG